MNNSTSELARDDFQVHRVRWLLRSSMELETVACSLACTHAQECTAKSKTPQEGDNPVADQLRLCCRQMAIGSPSSECWKEIYAVLRTVIDDILDRTFEGKCAVTVVDWLRGFSSSVSRPTLRVEVVNGNDRATRPETYIVKMTIADKFRLKTGIDIRKRQEDGNYEIPSDKLKQELMGDAHLCQEGKSASPVFTTLKQGCEEEGNLQSLKYSDAEHSLRADETVVTLERAVIDACHGRRRSRDAVKTTLVQLYSALENACYRNAHTRHPSQTDVDYLRRRLEKGVRNWLSHQTEAGRARNETLWALRDDSLEFIDAARYFNIESLPRMPEMLVGIRESNHRQ